MKLSNKVIFTLLFGLILGDVCLSQPNPSWVYQETKLDWKGNYNHSTYHSTPRCYVLSIPWEKKLVKNDYAGISQKITVPAGSNHKIEFWIQTNYIDKTPAVYSIQLIVDSTIVFQIDPAILPNQTNMPWLTKFEVVVPPQLLVKNQVDARLRLVALEEVEDSSIEVYLDDISLIVDGNPTTTIKNGDFSANELIINRTEWQQTADLSWNFMKTKMMNPQGGVYTNYFTDHVGIEFVNHLIYTEAIGLQLWCGVLLSDQDMIITERNYIKNLFSPYETLYWQVDEANVPLPADSLYSNAPIDDFRIVNGLLEHYDLTGDQASLDMARRIGNGLLSTSVVDNLLVYSLEWTNSGGAQVTYDRFPLDYADLYVMARLAEWNPGWIPVILECKKLIEASVINEKGLLYGSYDTHGRFFYGDFEFEEVGAKFKHQIKSIQALWPAIALARIGERDVPEKVYNFFKKTYLESKNDTTDSYISEYYFYDGTSIEKQRGDERTFALVARLGHLLDDIPFGQQLIMDEIFPYQIKQTDSLFYGAFGIGDYISVNKVKKFDTEYFNNQEPIITFMQYLNGFTIPVVQVPNLTQNLPEITNSLQNYPNPFNATTTFQFEIGRSGPVILKIYNILGQEVATLLNQEMIAGKHKVPFNASKISSGIYTAVLQAPGTQNNRQFLLLK